LKAKKKCEIHFCNVAVLYNRNIYICCVSVVWLFGFVVVFIVTFCLKLLNCMIYVTQSCTSMVAQWRSLIF